MLRAARDAYRVLLAECNRQKASEHDLGMLLAYATVQDDLQASFDRLGRQLQRIENSGAGRSPADKGQGWPASAAAGGPSREARQGVQAPCPQTAVPFTQESRS